VVIMSVETDRLKAAQAKADEIIRAVGETPDGDLLLRIAVTDTVTGQRMATGFANYAVGDGPQPELAGERDLLRAVLEALSTSGGLRSVP
jgi:predicted transcriptional regulator